MCVCLRKGVHRGIIEEFVSLISVWFRGAQVSFLKYLEIIFLY